MGLPGWLRHTYKMDPLVAGSLEFNGLLLLSANGVISLAQAFVMQYCRSLVQTQMMTCGGVVTRWLTDLGIELLPCLS